MKRIYTFLFAVIIGGACYAQDTLKSSFNKIFPVNQLQSDFVFFRTVLEKAHPSLYRYQPKDSMEVYFNSARDKLDHPMNKLEYWQVLQSVLAKMGSGHTNVSFDKETNTQLDAVPHLALPFSIYTENNRLYVSKSLPKTDSLLKPGSEILVINNQLGASILRQMQELMSGDGYSSSYKDYKIELSFNYLYNLLHGEQLQFLVTYRYKGLTKTKLFKAINLIYRPAQGYGLPSLKYPDDMPATAILRIPNFEYKNEYFALHRKLFKEIKEHNIRNLVIDVRSNPGGQLSIAADLMQYFMKNDFKFSVADERYVNVGYFEHLAKGTADGTTKLRDFERIDRQLSRSVYNEAAIQYLRAGNYKGRVYLLVNGGTYSAAALFAAAVKSQSDYTIIGEETGGGAAGCDGGTFAEITLPGTRLKLRLPLLFMYSLGYKHDQGTGLMPDIVISSDMKEQYFSQGLNPSMEILKQTINAAESKAN